MPLLLQKNTVLMNYSGLAIHDDCLRFIEVDSEGNNLKQAEAPLEEGCVVNGRVEDFELLGHALNELHKSVGRLHDPVMIGLPHGDTVVRLINLPNMSIEDLRGTIDLNFDDYFPYARAEAVFDVIRLLTPADDAIDREEITVLAAAAKRELVEKLLDIARKSGLPAGAVEPISFAMIRAVPEAAEGMSMFADPTNIVAVYNGNGIYYRITDNTKGTQDIVNTMQFMSTQYRRNRINRLILAGLNFQINAADSGIDIINVTDPYYAARGLALRNDPNAHRLDLRPAEYVELERRRFSFNPNRLMFWGLLVGFVMLSIGTISFALMRIREIDLALEEKRIFNSDLLARRAELAKSNADLEVKRKNTEKILNFLKGDIPVLEVMNALEANAAVGVKFETADFVRNSLAGVIITIDGKASSEKAIITMTEGLKQNPLFADVRLPVSQKAQTGQIVFKLVLRTNEVM